ncbi:hypothetical protein OTU49_007933 [Cherax quadricarinatus]|uniref:Uncharacterized protein n=1 Tax=Cherax quadricarinatus TaxID=27406 RepID=A0AAW0WFF7_CHEQU
MSKTLDIKLYISTTGSGSPALTKITKATLKQRFELHEYVQYFSFQIQYSLFTHTMSKFILQGNNSPSQQIYHIRSCLVCICKSFGGSAKKFRGNYFFFMFPFSSVCHLSLSYSAVMKIITNSD